MNGGGTIAESDCRELPVFCKPERHEPIMPVTIIAIMHQLTPRPHLAAPSLSAPSVAFSQDTQTEREAARDVLKKMSALEQSLDVPGLVSRLTGPDAERDRVVARARELMDKELLTLADDIATHPEIGFEETRSIGKLTDFLRQHNFSVETGSGGLSTAFVAKFRQNNGSPTLGVILEYDALRGTKGGVPRRPA